jgi:hypothetical protein
LSVFKCGNSKISFFGLFSFVPTQNLSKTHVNLGSEPFDSPYKMIAADANKLNGITSFDIIEFRKLILGIYTELPANTSWRFVDKSYTFSTPPNPFQPPFPESRTVGSLPDADVSFVAVKVGDVNYTADPGCSGNDCTATPLRPAGARPLLEARKGALKSGDFYTLPVRMSGETPVIAWQCALRFDPDALELIGPSAADAAGLSAQHFNLAGAANGLIRTLWFADTDHQEEEALRSGQTMFYLTFRVKRDLPEQEPLLQIAEGVMPNLCWTAPGEEWRLQSPQISDLRTEENSAPAGLDVRCYPNPGNGELFFDIPSPGVVKRIQLTVFDAFGHRLWQRDLRKEQFPLQLGIPEAAAWPGGVYKWELRYDKNRSAGSFIRH